MKKIPLTQNKTAVVDDESFDLLSKHKWCFNDKNGKGHGYAQRSQHIKLGFKKYTSKTIYMHRSILDTDLEVDHINGDTLDNRKENLRAANRTQQTRNTSSRKGSTSSFVGVHFHKLTGKWRSQIKIDGKIRSLGLFASQEEANNARIKFIEENALERFRR
jgi:hypothetical protein